MRTTGLRLPLRRGRRGAATAVAAGLALSFALTGCSQPVSSLAQSATDARSAVSSAELAVQQQAADHTLLTVTQTALLDARTHLLSAQQSAAEVDPTTDDEVAAQQQTLADIRAATDAVLAAQRAIDSDASAALPALQSSAGTLTNLADSLETTAEK